MKWSALTVALGLGPAAASIIAFSPPEAPEISFSLTIPNTTAAANTGPIYIQMVAPTSMQWVGLGQGAQMAGSNMFIMYASSGSNITLSPRNGLGHFEPKPNPSSEITLLPGTGITNNTMTANIRCDNYSLPFSSSPPHAPPKSMHKILIAHATLMCLTFVFFFPLFAFLVPSPLPISIAKIHAPLQLFTLALAIAGFGMGVYLASTNHELRHAHPVIGIIVIGILTLVQPAMGIMQHRHFKREGGKSVFAYAHRWVGRCMIILGMINGGLGFRMAGVGGRFAPRGVVIAYGVVAGCVGVAYLETGERTMKYPCDRKRDETNMRR
ncbi:CBD9-like protein [Aspergillus heteromorphus CBS 117.55]|uniref:CBD9-like protein n=1 Tax=Aspergillus heteromorphus CBS 117.55 TaxID=1448321 RepID=A0A317VQT0_9EURO|nr:CBD9-like protein [Aspergillus heteromorphus CBS 117.55]PWY75387.1 CBD9-like protein [Aspergillus heteromorphus CBS 117.55]